MNPVHPPLKFAYWTETKALRVNNVACTAHVLVPSVGLELTHAALATLFLRQPGAPLDNNICERGLKKVILHRKNALFYKNQNGAKSGISS